MTTITDEKKVRCNIHNYDLPEEKRNELWEIANEIALLNRSTGLLNLFEKFWNQQAGFVVFERFLYACMNEYASQFSTSVPVSEEEKNVYRSEGWDAAVLYQKAVAYDGADDFDAPNKQQYLNSFK